MEYKSNLNDVIKKFQLEFLSDSAQEELIETVAKGVFENNKRNIFDKGLNFAGSQIGHYSQVTKRIRQKLGLETNYVNLTFTGYMKKIYRMRKSQKWGYTIGFTEPYGAVVAQKNERHFKAKIFGLTKSDEKVAKAIITKYIKKFKNK